jgi:hypothetical protein
MLKWSVVGKPREFRARDIVVRFVNVIYSLALCTALHVNEGNVIWRRVPSVMMRVHNLFLPV